MASHVHRKHFTFQQLAGGRRVSSYWLMLALHPEDLGGILCFRIGLNELSLVHFGTKKPTKVDLLGCLISFAASILWTQISRWSDWRSFGTCRVIEMWFIECLWLNFGWCTFFIPFCLNIQPYLASSIALAFLHPKCTCILSFSNVPAPWFWTIFASRWEHQNCFLLSKGNFRSSAVYQASVCRSLQPALRNASWSFMYWNPTRMTHGGDGESVV